MGGQLSELIGQRRLRALCAGSVLLLATSLASCDSVGPLFPTATTDSSTFPDAPPAPPPASTPAPPPAPAQDVASTVPDTGSSAPVSPPAESAAQSPAASADCDANPWILNAQGVPVRRKCHTLGLEFHSTSALPEFAWPPPTPSESMNLPRKKLLAGLGASPSLMAVSNRLVEALESRGYAEYTFYHVPRGFAVVVRLEKFEDDGSPDPSASRFLAPDAEKPFSFADFVKSIFVAPKGYYRMIVFVVTDSMIATQGAPDPGAAEDWLRDGANRLPRTYARMKFGADYEATVLVYEFKKTGSRGIDSLIPGRFDALTHLEKTGLLAALIGEERTPSR